MIDFAQVQTFTILSALSSLGKKESGIRLAIIL